MVIIEKSEKIPFRPQPYPSSNLGNKIPSSPKKIHPKIKTW
jgi:hypothetical protein